MNDLTIIVCSYNSPKVLHSMLQSLVYYIDLERRYQTIKEPINLILMENSTNEETTILLQNNNIPYIRNAGDCHSISVQKALDLCKTDYALLLDIDVLLNNSLGDIFKNFIKSKAAIFGELVKSRGGYNLKDRVGPWYCFIDVKQIKQHNILFHNQEKIDSSNSQGFFTNVPKQDSKDGIYYDVGSSFLEDIRLANLKEWTITEKERKELAYHAESLSWFKETNHREMINKGIQRQYEFFKEAKIFEKVNIYNDEKRPYFIGV